MIDISNKAVAEIKKEFVKKTKNNCVRVILTARGCGGPVFKLVESTTTDKDELRHEGQLLLAVERQLVDEFGGIRINYIPSHWGGGNFEICPQVNLISGGCGDCRC